MASVTIKFIQILTHTAGTDTVFLRTDLPSPFPPEVDEGPMSAKFEVQAGRGVEYVEEYLRWANVPVEVIDCRTGAKCML